MMRNSAQNDEGEHNHTEHWGKIGTLWREDWIYSKAFNCLKLFENSLYFCILMSLKICKLVIIKQPFSLAQPPRRPWGNLLKTSSFWCENQTVMTPLREKKCSSLLMICTLRLPSENKKKEYFMTWFMFYILSCHGLFDWNSLRMQNITFETLFILGLC